MKIVLEWSRGAPRIRVNPTCEMFVHGWGKYEAEKRCGKPAIERVNLMPHWSAFWCEEHARVFDHKAATA